MKSKRGVSQVMDLLALADLVQRRLRAKGGEWGLNVTQMRVLGVMGELQAHRSGRASEGRTPTEVAVELGMDTRPVAAQMRALLDRNMLTVRTMHLAGDRRERRYLLAASAHQMCELIKAHLNDVDIVLRSILGHEDATRAGKFMAKMAAELPFAPALLQRGSAIGFHREMRNQRRRASTARGEALRSQTETSE